jgi:hypothetical protein
LELVLHRDGSRIRFWDDVWYGELPLKEAFSVLYGFARKKDALVVDHMDYSSSSLQWDVSFVRAAHDWELDTVASFFTVLYSFRGRRKEEDKLWWIPSCKGKFDVRNFYKVLARNDARPFPWKSIWRTKAHVKVAFFA